MKMVETMPNMLDEIQHPLPLSHKEAARRLKQLWMSSDGLGDTWDDAELKSVAIYLIGAKGLQVPQDWEWIIPSHL